MDNLTFTTEQKEQLKNNVRAIERYIEENVVPYITGDVRLEFGGVYHCPRTGSPTAMYTLYVSPEKKSRYASLNANSVPRSYWKKGFLPTNTRY